MSLSIEDKKNKEKQFLVRAALGRHWKKLKDRKIHPDGKFDNKKRFYPDENEKCSCCSYIRSPSARFPYSYMTHCRSYHHILTKYTEKEEFAKYIRKEAKIETDLR